MTPQNNYASVANAFYLAFYGRPADPEGLAFWSQQLASVDGELADITLAFSTSQEAQTRFGSDTLNERITDIYQQLFNRAPDAAGLAYWAGAVSSGNATLADVAISILGGAQGSDQSLSALRLKAADAFTAAVDASDSGYSGYASIEAARVLLRSVTANASETDLTTLVRAAVSFADTATKTPSVVDAIASGSSLLALFDTVRGLDDPVALAQALADIAKAAAGDPVTLEQLLRGGGMAQVLKVMPASATLDDVVEALAEGGLPAAIDVVYPPTPTPTPVRSIDISFGGVTQGEDDAVVDNVTNQSLVDVTFTYTGPDLVDGQHFEYSLDGQNWNTVLSNDVNTASNIIKISHLYIGDSSLIQTQGVQLDVTTSITMRAVEGSRVLDSTQAQIVYDNTVPGTGISFVRLVDGADGVNTTTEESAGAVFLLDGELGDASVEYRLTGSGAWTVLDPDEVGVDGEFTIAGIDLSEADRTVEVRLIDPAGNASTPITQLIDGPFSEATPAFWAMPSLEGLEVGSNFVGDMAVLANSVLTPVESLLGSTKTTIGTTVVGAQGAVVSGTFTVTPDTGTLEQGALPYQIGLGTATADLISSNMVWGFDGADTISSSTLVYDSQLEQGSYLFGGAGDDIITGGAGSDMIVGGSGADGIDLSEGQAADDRVVYMEGDTATGVFADGDIIEGMDVITGFGLEDEIGLLNMVDIGAVVQTSYLTSVIGNDWSIVRGSTMSGTFTAGGRYSDNDYMVQWADGITVNSIILSNFSSLTPVGTLADDGQTLRFALPEITPVGFVEVSYSGLTIFAGHSPVTGIANPDGFILTDMGTGGPASAHVESSNGNLTIEGDFVPGVYDAYWDAGTFSTQTGVAGQGAFLFVGGSAGLIETEGFTLANYSNVNVPVESANLSDINDAFVAYATFTGEMHTGGGHDAVVDKGGVISIVYSDIVSSAYDMIFGFDINNDKIVFEDSAAMLLEKNDNGIVDWTDAPDLTTSSEATSVEVSFAIAVAEGEGLSDTIAVLNDLLDLTAFTTDNHLLIRAHDGVSDVDFPGTGAGVLYLFHALNDNGVIDIGELTVVAGFYDGMVAEADIQLIGLP